ncbi:hypothetical protein GCM10010377_12170 [Streptomyces viridiviolaceus]|nr:hypothetical protein GCM10010377_12170 [Streptomyces viridiviolaceus]
MAMDEHQRASLQAHSLPEPGDAGGQFLILHRVEAMSVSFERLSVDTLLSGPGTIMGSEEAGRDDVR